MPDSSVSWKVDLVVVSVDVSARTEAVGGVELPGSLVFDYPTAAAIASEQAAVLHGLPILRRDIADHPENFTRMVIVATEHGHYPDGIDCKTSLIFSTIHEQGALARCIAIFAERGLNLTKIESRPKPDTPFEYVFYMDFEGNVDREATQAALEDLEAVVEGRLDPTEVRSIASDPWLIQPGVLRAIGVGALAVVAIVLALAL